MENGNDVIVGGNDVAVAAAANDAETSSDLHLGRNDSVKVRCYFYPIAILNTYENFSEYQQFYVLQIQII